MPVGDAVQSLLQLVFDSNSAGFLEKLSFKARLLVHRFKQLTTSPVARKPFEAVLEAQVYAMFEDSEFHRELTLALTMDDRIFFVIKFIVNRIYAHYIRSLQHSESLDLVAAIREVVSMLMSNLFVYVGRIAIKKNPQLMAQAYRQLQTMLTSMQSTHLIIMGDGPYRQALEAQLKGLPVAFTGYLYGDVLR